MILPQPVNDVFPTHGLANKMKCNENKLNPKFNFQDKSIFFTTTEADKAQINSTPSQAKVFSQEKIDMVTRMLSSRSLRDTLYKVLSVSGDVGGL